MRLPAVPGSHIHSLPDTRVGLCDHLSYQAGEVKESADDLRDRPATASAAPACRGRGAVGGCGYRAVLSTAARQRPTPYGDEIEPRAGGQPAGPVDGVAAKQLDGIAPHKDTQVVLGLGQEAVRIDQLEAAVVLEGVQLVHVAVDQHSPLVAMRLSPPGAQARAWSTVFSEHGRSSSSHDVTMKSASHRALSAPVGSPQSGAGRHMRSAVAQRISRRRASGSPSSYMGRPSRSMSKAPWSGSCR